MIMRVLSAAALIAGGIMLAGCQTIPGAAPVQNQRVCTAAGAPPGSTHYEECLAAIDEQIDAYKHELLLEYGYISTQIEWDCEAELRGDGWWIVCEPHL